MKTLPLPFAPFVTTKGMPLISFNDIAKLFNITPAQLRAEFRASRVPLPPVRLASENTPGPPSKAGWYDLGQIKRWRSDAKRAQRLALND